MDLEVTPKSLRNVLHAFSNGQILLPQFQRSFVWKSRQIRNLLDSLMRDYPIGAFYLWRPSQDLLGPKPSSSRALKLAPAFMGYLVDGQQRLTSLEAAFSLYEGEDEGQASLRCFLDLAANDEPKGKVTRLFQTYESNKSTKQRVDQADVTLIPVDRLLQGSDPELRQEVEQNLQHLGWAPDDIQSSLRRLNDASRMLDQMVPCITMQNIGDHDAIEVFGRLNKGGKALQQSDMHAAELARGHAVDVLSAIREFVDEPLPKQLGFGFSFAFRALVVFHRHSAKFHSLTPEWVQAPAALHGGTLSDSWQRAAKNLRRAFDFVDQSMGWSRRTLVPSMNGLIVLAFAMSRETGKPPKDAELLYARWLCLTALAGTFRGSVETTMDRFLRTLKETELHPAEALNGSLKRDERRPLSADTFNDYASPWGAHTQVMLAWLSQRGACDWVSGKSLETLARTGERHKPGGDVTVHHIFPRKVIADQYGDPAEANCPANYALIGSPTNSQFGEVPPREVLEGLTSEQRERAAMQLVSSDAGDRLNTDQYEAFCEWRAERLASSINAWLGLR